MLAYASFIIEGKMNNILIRECVFLLIYNDMYVEKIEENKCSLLCDENKEYLDNFVIEKKLTDEEASVCIEEARSIIEQSGELLQKIEPLTKYSIKKNLFLPELCLIILGVWELENRSGLSFKIVINECVELAKKYAEENAYKLVNGVLKNFVKEDV